MAQGLCIGNQSFSISTWHLDPWRCILTPRLDSLLDISALKDLTELA